MQFSILVPTLKGREHFYDKLLQRLEPQLFNEQGEQIAQVIEYKDNREKTTGYKRNKLIEQCTTPYASFIDDDDLPDFDYVSSITEAIAYEPDCITFNGQIFSGYNCTNFTFKIGYPYDDKPVMLNGKRTYRRPPNHLCCIKTEILKQFPFPDLTRFEDFDQCLRMAEAGALKTQYHIDKILYHYYYNHEKEY